jgi:cyanophycinase-like exopeptidase
MPAEEALLKRLPGSGWLALLGGGEFSFGETLDADRGWLARTAPGAIGFLPAASGSNDYPRHFGHYLASAFEREVVTLPIYRARDARRAKNVERISALAAIYLGGGVADHLLEALAGSVAAQALAQRLLAGGVVVAIAAAAQATGRVARSIQGGALIPGLGWLPDGVVEPNFDPGHDRRLRKMLEAPGVTWGVGIPTSSALLLGPGGALEVVGTVFHLAGADGDLEVVAGTSPQP